ncbi:phosphotransferase [Patescibacteria group bacterium]|nr:phosphotransferase [Patescibacteria group bacterium]MBU1922129.1 phosphotransferase [Patescibacteria group bacterium]
MKNYLSRIKKIKKQFTISEKERFVATSNGTNYKVFLSNNYVIRFRDENPKLLLRETNFLKQLNHVLIPKILWFGKIDQSFFMIENRLPGQTINLVWKNLSTNNKKNIIEQVVKFLQYQKTEIKGYVYSVKTGRKYKRFLDYLTDGVKQKTANIKKFKPTNEIMGDLLLIINDPAVKNLFTIKTKTSLVHGDLIIHNLLTDGKKLTGVLDWELALWGDPDYDLSRLFYYWECAKAYQEQGTDETFESDYMDKLITAILKSNLIEDKKLFRGKHQFVRAAFYLNSLYWAANSDSPEKNISELIAQWNKKAGLSI